MRLIFFSIWMVCSWNLNTCLFSTKEKFSEVKSQVKNFFNGLTSTRTTNVADDNNMEEKTALYIKVKSLSEQGLTSEQVKAASAADIESAAEETGTKKADLEKRVFEYAENNGTFIKDTSIKITCSTSFSNIANVSEHDGATRFLSGIKDEQLICIPGYILAKINMDSLKKHLKNKNNVGKFTTLVREEKEGLLKLTKDSMQFCGESIKTIEQIKNRLPSSISNLVTSSDELVSLVNLLTNSCNTGSTDYSTKARNTSNMEVNLSKLNQVISKYNSFLGSLFTDSKEIHNAGVFLSNQSVRDVVGRDILNFRVTIEAQKETYYKETPSIDPLIEVAVAANKCTNDIVNLKKKLSIDKRFKYITDLKLKTDADQKAYTTRSILLQKQVETILISLKNLEKKFKTRASSLEKALKELESMKS